MSDCAQLADGALVVVRNQEDFNGIRGLVGCVYNRMTEIADMAMSNKTYQEQSSIDLYFYTIMNTDTGLVLF